MTQKPDQPKIGDKMPDGTIFAGISPDTGMHIYIRTAEEDCAAALDDIRALQSGSDLPWIGIDFSELCGYLSADPSLCVHLPLVDFCLAHSPSPVILPPGSIANR
jgi:hypothetical protein